MSSPQSRGELAMSEVFGFLVEIIYSSLSRFRRLSYLGSIVEVGRSDRPEFMKITVMKILSDPTNFCEYDQTIETNRVGSQVSNLRPFRRICSWCQHD